MKKVVKAWVADPFQGSFWVGQDVRRVWRFKPYDPAFPVEIHYDDGRQPKPRRGKKGKR